jgi:multidrug efflux pump subunit AcrB
MNKWIHLAIKERKVTILLSLMILVYGVYAYYYVPKQENPDTSSPVAQIITIYPGATASEVEELVTKKIEDEIATLDGVESITSYSNPNVSVVLVTLNFEVDYREQWEKMRVQLDGIKHKLPSNVFDFQIDTELTTSAGIIISLSGENYTYEQLQTLSGYYKEILEQVDGVKRIVIEGGPEKEIHVVVDSNKLSQLPIANRDIMDLISAQNVSIPSGDIKTPYGKIGVKSPKGFESIQDIESLIVYGSEETGGLVRLRDVADVSFEYNDSFHRFKYEDQNAVLLTVYFKSDENVILIGKDVRTAIDEINSGMPSDLNIREVLYQPQEVDDSVKDFMVNLMQGVLFVVLVVLLGMGMRNAIVVSTTIPLSIAITMILMYVLGIDIQQMSIAALIIALGILVDNSIVISDAIQVKLNEGETMFEASYHGTTESSIPVLTSTLTTVAAFAPLMVLPGEAGEFAKSLPQVVIIALVASYAVAMFVTPALGSIFFKGRPKHKHKPKNRMRHFFENILRGALKRRALAFALIILILIGTGYAALFLNIELFPYADKDIMYIDIYAERSGDQEYTENLADRLFELLKEEPEIDSISTSIGGGFPKFYLTVGVRPPSDDYAQLLFDVDLSNGDRFSDREEFAYYLQTKLDEKLIGGSATVNLIEINQPGPAIDIKISGLYREDVNRVAGEVYNYLIAENSTINIGNDQPKLVYQYKINVDDDLASNFGLTKYDIQYQSNLALKGMVATVFQKEGNTYDVIVKNNMESVSDVVNLEIKSSFTGEKVSLSQFANVSLEEEYNTIKRFNRRASVAVSTDLRPGFSSGELQNKVETELLANMNLEGVTIDFGGDQEIIEKYISGLLGAALFAVVVIYIILLIQFNSLLQPIIILMTVPLSVVGSVFILLIFGMSVTFTVGLGVASLIGIVVNNAILLIEYINRERLINDDLMEACIDSVEKRFRPIMLSTITTVIGLVPLATSGSSFFTPMALALMGGLLVSTVLTLIVIPLIYYSLEKR